MTDSLSFEALSLLVVAPFVGSFLGVLALRLPHGENVVTGRSHCRDCRSVLGPIDLVPLLSWTMAQGRCRHCDAPVGAFYPAVELGALGVVIWAIAAVEPSALVVTVLLGWTLLCLAVMDVRSLVLADVLTLPLIVAGLGVCLWFSPEETGGHVMAALAAGALLAAVALGYRHLRGREGLGLGDVKLFAAAGAWCGPLGLGPVLLWAVVVNAALLLVQGRGRLEIASDTKVPFGAGLAAGIWLTWLYGPLSIV
jgi:leader peptidase (prepilin peptidase)/N-methyltransferase